MTLEALAVLCAARKSREDLPLAMTLSEANAYVAETVTREQRFRIAPSATQTLAALRTEADVRWRGLLNAWRDALFDELLAFKSPIRDPKILGQHLNVRLSIRCIDFGPDHALRDSGYDLTTTRLGQLMRDAGYEAVGADPDHNYAGVMPWFGSLPEVEGRSAQTEARRAAAQAALDEALLDDDERERRDAESEARRVALNNAPVRKVRGDGSVYLRHADGRREEIRVTRGG